MKRYPGTDRLAVMLTAVTQITMPASVVTIPATWSLDGRFFRSTADRISETTGMLATKMPHSVDVVRLMPSVSPRKYTHGQSRITRRSGISGLPRKRTLMSPAAMQTVMTMAAIRNRQPRMKKTPAVFVDCLVNA